MVTVPTVDHLSVNVRDSVAGPQINGALSIISDISHWMTVSVE
jgi:hypothetical protein